MSVSVIENPYAYKLIYVFRSPEEKLRGLLKIGDATVPCTLSREAAIKAYPPNCQALNDAANARIKGYMGTSGMAWQLLYTELAFYNEIEQGEEGAFRDFDVHGILRRSGHPKVILEGSNAREWFRIPLPVAVSAIQAAKARRAVLSAKESNPTFIPVTLWPNQREAVDLAKARFDAGAPAVLWNAKMRFGKTISAMTLIKEQKYRKVLICTHRPVVRKGWKKEYLNVFGDSDAYVFLEDEATLARERRNVIYFASIQDLRGSSVVSGKFNKNTAVFNMDWDLVIIDEAHEGTQTELGTAVIDALTHKKKAKVLALSGTPYNILGDFPVENTYTWDYVAERKTKQAWDKTEGCANPYASLPEMHLLTYALGEEFEGSEALVTLDNSFSFSEFFRVRKADGRFVHEADVKKFLALLRGADPKSNYPFATEEYRKALKHTLWKLPGVPECTALKALLRQDPLFGNFEVVNVAGEGDVDGDADNALKTVDEAIAKHEYTLTTGVTVPQWTGVLMLSGGDKIAAAAYLQTIFRVQSPYTDEEGRVKESCHVFDFAPDRVLSVLPKMCMNNTPIGGGTGGPQGGLRGQLNALLKNFLPVLAFKGGKMSPVEPNHVFRHIRRAEAERAIRSGFSDESIYNTDMLNAKHIDPALFNGLRAKIGRTQKGAPVGDFTLIQSPLSGPETELNGTGDKSPKPPMTEQEKERLRRLREERKQRENAIAILRGISIRLPLLIYGADVDYNQDISIHDFVDLVDDVSWAEFMPAGVTKEEFLRCIPYYDEETVRVAGHEIRALAKAADDHAPMQRVRAIARVFGYFRNPDKETVLTPWRVVNRHLAETVGGWCFMDEDYAEPLDEPRWVEQGEITRKTFGKGKARVLEVNSKSGLYPLYVAYTLFRRRLDALQAKGEELTLDRQWQVWDTVVRENLFVICKTKMALTITRRTLLGYRAGSANLECYNNLIHDLRHNQDKVVRNLRNPFTWGLKESLPMHFNAIVGNPPYHVADGGAKASALPLYNLFFGLAKAAKPDVVSMIMEARWMMGGRGLDEFRAEMLKDHQLVVLHDFMDSRDCFPNVDIKGGVCFVLWERGADRPCKIYTYKGGSLIEKSERFLAYEGSEVFLRMEASSRRCAPKRKRPSPPLSPVKSPTGCAATSSPTQESTVSLPSLPNPSRVATRFGGLTINAEPSVTSLQTTLCLNKGFSTR